MKAFVDTNVLIDFIAEREPHFRFASVLFQLAEIGSVCLVYSSISVVNVFYVLRKYFTNSQLTNVFERQKTLVGICDVTSKDVFNALSLEWPDFEDSIQYEVAKTANCDVIITRNVSDFQKSSIPVLSPQDFLEKYF